MDSWGQWSVVLSHPSHKNKDVARMGHPELMRLQAGRDLVAGEELFAGFDVAAVEVLVGARVYFVESSKGA
jgi:hypothetical protein